MLSALRALTLRPQWRVAVQPSFEPYGTSSLSSFPLPKRPPGPFIAFTHDRGFVGKGKTANVAAAKEEWNKLTKVL